MTPRQTKLALVLTAAICLPLGALTQRQASAQKRLDVGLDDLKPTAASHFEAAQFAVHAAWNEINASRRADEDVWHDDAGHGAKAMDLIEHALNATDQAVAWAQADPSFLNAFRNVRLFVLSKHGWSPVNP